jgi:GH43 family beta-xylosidase
MTTALPSWVSTAARIPVSYLLSFSVTTQNTNSIFSLVVVAGNWWRLDDRPVMWKSSAAFGPGHGSFTSDRNGVPYIVFHANERSGSGWDGRTIRTQSFGWNADGSPAFPTPAGFGQAFNRPA